MASRRTPRSVSNRACRCGSAGLTACPKSSRVESVPFNAALRHRARHDGATRKSLAAYARAGALYATYCAHQRVGLLDISNDEFPAYVDGILGLKFRNASGDFVHLDGHARSRASADLYLALLYSLTGDVAHLYDVSFDWRRYRMRVGSERGLTAVPRANLVTGLGQRAHRIRHTARKCSWSPRSGIREDAEAGRRVVGRVPGDR